MMCRKDNKKNLCQVDGRHLLKSMTCRKNKSGSLCQIGTLCQSQEIMTQVARGFVCFVFMCIATEIIFALDLSSLLNLRSNNHAIF